MSFAGKVVWITGASSGIGAALADALSQQGAKLILSARNEEKLCEIQQRCRHSQDHLVLPLDLSKSETLNQAVSAVLHQFSRIDILINNGGVSQRALAKDTDMNTVRRLMEVNFFGTVALTKAVLPVFLKQQQGHIVTISSLMGKIGSPLRSGYGASKHALHGFMDSLRAEIWRDGIKVTMICPGFIRTNVSFNALTGDATAQGTMDSHQARGMDPAKCAQKILRAIAQEKDEVIVAGIEAGAVYMKRFCPALFNRFIRTAKVT